MFQANTAHFFQPDDGPEVFVPRGRVIVRDDHPAVVRNPGYFDKIEPPADEPSGNDQPPSRRGRRGG